MSARPQPLAMIDLIAMHEYVCGRNKLNFCRIGGIDSIGVNIPPESIIKKKRGIVKNKASCSSLKQEDAQMPKDIPQTP